MDYTISSQEIRSRRQVLLLLSQGQPIVLFSPKNIFYYSNFGFIPTERPIALLITPEAKAMLFVPRLEEEHATNVVVNEIAVYPDYPSEVHPMARLKDILPTFADGPWAADQNGYGAYWGYEGPSLTDLFGENISLLGKAIRQTMQIKSPSEIALIRESCRWGTFAHRLLQEGVRVGASEYEIGLEASKQATQALVQTMGATYALQSPFPLVAHATFRGQVGAQSAIPHATTTHAILQPKDTLITGASARIFGYVSELERTMFVGEPSLEQRHLFDLMLTAQDLAKEAIRPDIPCSVIDEITYDFFRDHEVLDLWRHHTGHAIGLDGHESPFFDRGDQTILKPGMVFSVEPGLYLPGLGGFRHSDTLVVTETGSQWLTDYPRELDQLTIEI